MSPNPPFQSLFSYRELLRRLIAKDLKVKYRGSYLGVLWSMLHPLTLVLIYSVVLKYILKAQVDPLLIIAGVIPWLFFSNAVTDSTMAIVGNANLVKKVAFPREILPLASVAFHLVQFGFALLVVGPTVYVLKGFLPITLIYYPLVTVLHWTFAIGLALLLSALTTFYKDIRYLTEVSLMLVFWATPVLYSRVMIPEGMRWVFWLNPLSAYFFGYQDAVFFERSPDWVTLTVMLFWSCFAVFLGWTVFRKTKNSFAEEL